MKTVGRFFLFFTILATVYSCAANRNYNNPRYDNRRSETITTQLFYDELSPYGDWVHNREYGYVWMPNVGRNFYPYASNGKWIYTDYGWTWLSDYQWGWATFHYGRWDYDPQYGWFWFPGDEWAPAWVVWRQGDGYFGWAPMRPESGFGWDFRNNDEVYRWIFVKEHDFGRTNIERYYVSKRRNDDIIRNTRVISDYRADETGRKMMVSGPNPSDVENVSGRRIRKITVKDSNIPGRRLNNNELEIYRPRVIAGQNGQRPAPPRISDVKDIRPMRERNRDYEPATTDRNEGLRQYGGQGDRDTSREVNREQVQNRRERDVQRQYEQKQAEMQRRKQEQELEEQRNSESGRRQSANKEYDQTRSERIQRTDQQKKTMQKERERNIRESSDTSGTRRTERVQTRSVRQRR